MVESILPRMSQDELRALTERGEPFAIAEGNCSGYVYTSNGKPYIFGWRIIGEPLATSEQAAFILKEIERLESLGLIERIQESQEVH